MTQTVDISQQHAVTARFATRSKALPKIATDVARQVKDLRKKAARQKLDFIEARVEAMELGGGNPKSRARELARLGRSISSTVREYKSLSPSKGDAKNFAKTAEAALNKVRNVAKWHKTSLVRAGLPVQDGATRHADLSLRIAARDIQGLEKSAAAGKFILDVTI